MYNNDMEFAWLCVVTVTREMQTVVEDRGFFPTESIKGIKIRETTMEGEGG